MTALAISPTHLAFSALLLLVVGILGLVLRLDTEKKLAIAAVRTVLQLTLLGVVLKWVFEVQAWWLATAMVGSMIVNASVAAVKRTNRRYKGIWLSGLGSITLSTVFTTSVVIAVVIPIRPWYEPQYIIPLAGMILGNSLTGLGLCLDTLMRDFDEKREEIEAWLALGATSWEACQGYVRGAIRTGMIPILNSMTVVGLVSIPGMMTGQILAGTPPEHAVRYQIIVMFMIAAATSLSTVIISLLAFRSLVTKSHQLASHRIKRLS